MSQDDEWIPCRKFGIAIYNYDNYALCVGDTVHITEECQEWYYGTLIQDASTSGLYPKSVLRVKECIEKKIGNLVTVKPKDPPAVQEITGVLRDWGTLYKTLYLTNQEHFMEVKKSIFHLIEWRRAIMSKKLTNDELKEHYRKANSQIDICNRILGLDLIVRNESGEIVNPDETSTLHLYHRHKETTQQLKKTKQEHRATLMFFRKGLEPELKPNQRHTLNLFVTVRNFVCRVGDDTDVVMALFDARQGVFFSENFVVKWSQEGLPKDIEMLNNIRILFTDLGSKDLRSQRDSVYLVCRIIRVGNMFPQEMDGLSKSPAASKGGTVVMRRPCGVAVLDITDVLNGDNRPDDDKQFFIPFVPSENKDGLETLITTALKSGEEMNQKSAKGQGMWVSLKLLDGNSEQVKEDNPHLVGPTTCIARKMGFPEVIMPSDVRNDFYVTIRQGEFSLRSTRDGPRRLRERNIEVTMEVCNQEGQVVENVISLGAGSPLLNSFQTVVYRHDEKPKWFETVKVVVSISDFYNCHLRFLFRHRSSTEVKDRQERPFALAYVKFLSRDGTTLMDNIHNLMVYAIDQKKRSKEISPEYRSLPESDARDRVTTGRMTSGPYTYSPKESFSISTLVCSTKLTHNVVLLGLLNWRSNQKSLKQNLNRLTFVDGEEVVKFLQDTLDALFDILMQKEPEDVGEYGELVFEALIFIIGLIGDRKYQQFRPVVETYIRETFCATLAYHKLLRSLNFRVDNANDSHQSNSLYQAIKCIEFVMKFVIRSRLRFAELNEGKGREQFERSLTLLLESVNRMMLYTSDHTLKVQGAALKYMPATIADVLSVYDRGRFTQLFIQFIDNIPAKRLQPQKLNCLLESVQTTLFSYSECRKPLMCLIVHHVGEEIQAKGKNMALCAKLLWDILAKLGNLKPPESKEEIKIIVKGLLRTIMQTVIRVDRESEEGQDYVSIMIAILRQMEEHHYQFYFNTFTMQLDLMDCLIEKVMVFKDLIRGCVYPADWNDMIMLQNSVLLKALHYVAQAIKEKCFIPFNTVQIQLWSNFFHCAISFLTQGPLQLENFSEAKRHKIISRYKDMRTEMGSEVRSMWYNLGHHKYTFIPELVGPIVEMTLIPEPNLRKATLPIFFDMMQCEFTQHLPNTALQTGHFNKFEHEMIHQLDLQVEGGHGDEEYRELFVSVIRDRCANHQTMGEIGRKFVEKVGGLLQRLLEYRIIIKHENKEHRMNCIVNLLNFYRDIDRQEMYIRYLNKLRDLHLESENYTEAAHTLLLYTKLLRWTTDPLEPYLREGDHSLVVSGGGGGQGGQHGGSHMTHRELKERLYYTILEYFDKGKMWEAGIEICKELAVQYEEEIFDYKKLSKILTMQASFYDKIMKETRTFPKFFRVGYYGRGFPPFLANKDFVYVGREYETIADFTDRIRDQFTDAEVRTAKETPGDDIKQSSAQYLLIHVVLPVYEPMKKFEGKTVSGRVLSYWKQNEVRKFSFAENVGPVSDLTKLRLDMTTLTISYPLPGILHWFPICSSYTVHMTPIELAIQTLQDANEDLQAVIEESEINPALAAKTLSMKLKGVADANVNQGVKNYQVFYTGTYLEGETVTQKDRENIARLKSCTTQLTVLLAKGLGIYGRTVQESMLPMYKHLMSAFENLVELIQQYGMIPPEEVLAMHKMRRAPSVGDALDSSCATPTATAVGSPALQQASDFSSSDVRKAMGGNSRSMLSVTQLRLNRPGKNRSNSKIQSEVSTDSRDSSSDTDKGDASSNSVIELTQQLTPARPKRPESRGGRAVGGSGGRPNSSHYSSQPANVALSAARSMPMLLNGGGPGGTAGPEGGGGLSLPPASDSQATVDRLTIEEETPPPLPEKKSCIEYGGPHVDFTSSPATRNGGRSSRPNGSSSHYHSVAQRAADPPPAESGDGDATVLPSGVRLRGSHKGRPPPPLPVKPPAPLPDAAAGAPLASPRLPPVPAKKSSVSSAK